MPIEPVERGGRKLIAMHKILVVDDDKNIVKALTIRLQAAGYGVVPAYDGTAALQAAEREHPSLIILDVSLPFASGLRVARQLQEASGRADTPLIFITASKVPGLRDQAQRLGAVGFFEKPYEADAVLELVRAQLEQPIRG